MDSLSALALASALLLARGCSGASPTQAASTVTYAQTNPDWRVVVTDTGGAQMQSSVYLAFHCALGAVAVWRDARGMLVDSHPAQWCNQTQSITVVHSPTAETVVTKLHGEGLVPASGFALSPTVDYRRSAASSSNLTWIPSTWIGTPGADRFNASLATLATFAIYLSGADVATGGSASDSFIAEEGQWVANGGPGSDSITCTSSSGVTVNMTALASGTVRFAGGAVGTFASVETVFGTEEADAMTGSSSNDVLKGLGGADLLSGGQGNDDLDGGSGDDVLWGGDGWNRLDQVHYDDSPASVVIDLNALYYIVPNNGWGSSDLSVYDYVVGIEVFYGSSHADNMTGDSSSNDRV
eukprot:m51a1_g615 hypothetical protein (354) ;mRNA; r:99720-101050